MEILRPKTLRMLLRARYVEDKRNVNTVEVDVVCRYEANNFGTLGNRDDCGGVKKEALKFCTSKCMNTRIPHCKLYFLSTFPNR